MCQIVYIHICSGEGCKSLNKTLVYKFNNFYLFNLSEMVVEKEKL